MPLITDSTETKLDAAGVHIDSRRIDYIHLFTRANEVRNELMQLIQDSGVQDDRLIDLIEARLNQYVTCSNSEAIALIALCSHPDF